MHLYRAFCKNMFFQFRHAWLGDNNGWTTRRMLHFHIGLQYGRDTSKIFHLAILLWLHRCRHGISMAMLTDIKGGMLSLLHSSTNRWVACISSETSRTPMIGGYWDSLSSWTLAKAIFALNFHSTNIHFKYAGLIRFLHSCQTASLFS